MALSFTEDKAISSERTFTDCVVLDKDAFDPDAVFHDDIVDDDVLPRLTLAVDGLTESDTQARKALELPPEDVAANDPTNKATGIPNTSLGPEHLEVYGWESSLWRKLRGYLGF